MKEDRLRKMIKTMYLLREVLRQKQEDDKAFRFKPKTKVLTEIDDIIVENPVKLSTGFRSKVSISNRSKVST